MGATTGEAQPEVTTEHPQRHPRRWLLAAVAGLVVLGAVAGGAWWLTHPERFIEAGSVVEFDPGAVHVAVGIQATSGQQGEILIRDMTANVARDDAGASFEAKRCTLEAGLDFAAIGSAGVEELSTLCSDLVDAAGASLSLDAADRQQLLLVIHAPDGGRVELDGVHVTYRDGVRWGAEDTGPDVVVP